MALFNYADLDQFWLILLGYALDRITQWAIQVISYEIIVNARSRQGQF